MIRWVESVEQQTMYVGNTGFVTDPRTGETLSSDMVFFNSAIKDTYVDRIDAYLQSIGASPGLYTNSSDWPSSPAGPPDASGNPTSLPVACNVGDTAPILSATVVANHNGLSTLFAKMQSYLYQPASQYGALGPQDFIVPQDADFLKAYFAYLPYIIYGDANDTNPLRSSGERRDEARAAGIRRCGAMMAQEAQFHAAARRDRSGPVALRAHRHQHGLDESAGRARLPQQLQGDVGESPLAEVREAVDELPARGGSTAWETTTTQLTRSTNFSMEAVMAKDARRCVTIRTANSTPHWETKQEWIDSLVSTYWSQVMWHEFGHSQGLTHNFMGSVDANNFPVQTDASGKPVLDASGNPRYKLYSSSVMEYNSQPDRVFWGAGWAPYDSGALAWVYANNGNTPLNTGNAAAQQISGQRLQHDPLERSERLPGGRQDRDPVPPLRRAPHEVHAALPRGRPRHHAERHLRRTTSTTTSGSTSGETSASTTSSGTTRTTRTSRSTS